MLYWLKQIFYVFIFWEVGQLISFFSGGLYSGNVIGMLLLFFALLSGLISKNKVAGISKVLLRNMVLFFLPLIAGLISAVQIILPNLIPIIAAFLLSTLSVLAVVGLLEQFLENKWKK